MSLSFSPLCQPVASPDAWQVHFRLGAQKHVAAFKTADEATEAACRLIDGGSEFVDIETVQGSTAIDREQMAHLYARWSRARYH